MIDIKSTFMLEIRKNRFAKPYENEFFRIFSKKLSIKFTELGLNGVLLGSPVCTKRQDLQIDALLITETGIVIIDFKNYTGIIKLPETVEAFEKKPWMNITKSNQTIIIKGGNNKNPFRQVLAQKEKFDILLQNEIAPRLQENENIEIRDTYPVICFQQEISIEGEIPGHLKRIFHIGSPSNIINTLSDLLYVAPNEWNGKTKGYKLNQNAFDILKSIFRTDSYNPFEELSLFEEFNKIDFSNYIDEELFVEKQFKKNKKTIDEFFNSEVDILQVNCDSTSIKLPFTSKLIAYFFETNNDSNNEIGDVYCLAPTNRHVADLNRDGAAFYLQALYSRLYDFENTTIELMDDSIGERETFPLQKNNDELKSLYIIFNAHLVYNFEVNENDIIQFGSGSLCNDTLKFLDLKQRACKVILINDPLFYGFRAESIFNNAILSSECLSKLEIDLNINPLSSNEKTIATIENNFQNDIFNKLYWGSNSNVTTLYKDEFKLNIEHKFKSSLFFKTHVLTREKYDSNSINSWVRKLLNNSGNISRGDVVWIKTKVMLPEITDPYSIPKFALSGDMGVIKEIRTRYSFKSIRYNYKSIEVSLCKIQLYDYSSDKDIYLYDYPNSEISARLELKTHIQIRLREIVDDFLNKSNISVKDVLSTNDFEKYSNELDALKTKSLFKNEEVEEVDLNKLDARWKVNKKKEKFVRDTLMKVIDSEYFILNQLAFYEFGWSLSVKNSYGYRFNESFLVEYFHPENNAERVHKYLYSALSCSSQLYLHNLAEINPWLGINWINITIPLTTTQNQSQIIFKVADKHTTENIEKLKSSYNFQDKAVELIKFCEFTNNTLSNQESIKLLSIQHFNFQERYFFEKNGQTIKVNFSYNNQWEFKIQSNQVIDEELLSLLHGAERTNEPYHFIDDEDWKSKNVIELQEKLKEKNCFIFEFEHHNWLLDFKIASQNDTCRAQLNYNNDGFFTRLNIVNTTNEQLVETFINCLKEISQL